MKICFGITGSIAAYRSPDIVKDLVSKGHDVKVVLTSSARELVSARVLSTVSMNPVLSHHPFNEDHEGTDHISLARWADCFIIYAATAHFMARFAHGLSDDFLSLQLLAAQCPVFVAPAMNPTMWAHPAVRENYQILKSRGVHFIDPIHGKVACGEVGIGHIADSQDIIAALLAKMNAQLTPPDLFLKNKKVLISAGPMRTFIDPVRYVQNRSSGKMGLEIAQAAIRAGAKVTVLLGPVNETIEAAFLNCEIFRYVGPQDYGEKLEELFPRSDIFLSLAAVLDFNLTPNLNKIERSTLEKLGNLNIPLQSVQDFVALMASRKKSDQQVIAFAAESGTDTEILDRATKKMKKKLVNAIVANPVRPGLGPEAAENELWIIKRDQQPLHMGPAPKALLAEPLIRSLFK